MNGLNRLTEKEIKNRIKSFSDMAVKYAKQSEWIKSASSSKEVMRCEYYLKYYFENRPTKK